MSAALLLGVLLTQAATPPLENTPPAVEVSPAHIGSLQRVGAALQSTLDVYRLALVELVPAARSIVALARQPSSTPSTEIPAPAQEVFDRLHRSVNARVAAEALPAISRGYHADVLDALERLSLATQISEAAQPYRALARGLAGVLRGAEDVIDLFSRQRPVQVQLVDPETALDDINEALDEVAAAEQRIAELRSIGRGSGDQLQAFMRLEVALGRALDLIAAAEESGIRVGFEVHVSTEEVQPIAQGARRELTALESALAELERAPAGELEGLRAFMATPGPQARTQTDLSWRVAPGSSIAAVRVYRWPLIEDVRAELADAAICGGATREEALARALAETSAGSSRTRVGDYPASQGKVGESFQEELTARVVYGLAPLSAAGVEGPMVEVIAEHVPKNIRPVRGITATYTLPDPRSPRFYRDLDAVVITWMPSPNDEAGDAGAQQYARKLQLPLVDHYRVARALGGHAVVAAKLPPGTTQFVDRPPLEALANGVQYTVTAVGTDGNEAIPSDACLLTPPIDVELEQPLRLARLGAAWLGRPSAAELDVQRRLEADPAELARSRAELTTDAEELATWLGEWWRELPRTEREELLERWPRFVPEEEREIWLADAAAHLAERDREWLLPELWLADQPPELRAEVDRWWTLTSPDDRASFLRDWDAGLSVGHREWLRRERGRGDAAIAEALRPARVLAWWRSRQPLDRQVVHRWWDGLDRASRQLRVQAWMARQAAPVQTAVRWPDPSRLTDHERERLLDTAYEQLPGGLWPRAVAALRWRALDDDGRAGLVSSQMGLLGRSLATLRFALRPLDRALELRLPLFTALLAFAAVFAMAMRRVLRRRGAVEVRSPRGLAAIPELLAASRSAGLPALFVPGRVLANDPYTLAGLHLLEHAATTAAVGETTLLVAEREPFAQHRSGEEGVSAAGFALDPARALAPSVHPFVASASHVLSRERPGAAMFAGALPEELPLVTETPVDGISAPPPLIAAAEPAVVAYAAASTPHVLIAGELEAAAAEVTREAGALSTLTASDWLKLGVAALIGAGVLLETLGLNALAELWSRQ